MPLPYEDYVAESIRAQALPISPAALPLVVANLQMLEAMAQEVMSFALDPHVEPAPVFIP